MTGGRVELGVLGPSIARIDDTAVTLSAPRLRSLLGALVLWRGQTVPAERIIDVLWDGRPSPGASNTLQGYVANIRRLLEPQRQPRAAAEILVHEPGGYRLRVAYEQTDAGLFEAAVAAAQNHLHAHLPDPARPGIVADGDAFEALQHRLQEAMALWRGDAYADLEDFPAASAERRRLEELRVDARTASVTLDLALGRSAAAAATLEEMVSSHPLREQLWGLWAVALVRSDRQAHALEVLGRLRATLADELGIDPSPSINQLQEDILQQNHAVLGGGARPRADHGAAEVPPGPPASASASASAGSVRLAPLVGRDRELAQLQDAWREVGDGTARHCIVVGEAGIGKSRLSAEFVRWAVREHRAVVATARSVDTDGAPPLWALTRALAELSERTGVVLPDIGRAADEIEDEAAAAGRFALTAALSDFIQDVARVSPVLLVVEDAHWSDPTSLRVLRHVVDHALDVPIMILVNRRPEGSTTAAADLAASITRSGGLWLQLDGLDPGVVGELADHLGDHDLSASTVAMLHERTGGNPLYVTELLRARGQATEELPPSLAGLVRRRLSGLPADTILALEIAAVVGRRFTGEVVGRVWEDDHTGDLVAALEPARAAGILRERSDGSWLFAHALVRDAVLDGIRPMVRATWHARVARSLEDALADASVRGQVAWHWRAAGAQYARQAWLATAAAAERAQAVYAFPEEAQLLADAIQAQRIDAGSSDLERFELLDRRAAACRHASDWDGAAVAVIEAIAVAERMNQPELAARAATSLPEGSIWHVQRYGTVGTDLVHALRRSLELIESTDAVLRCRILLSIATESFYVATPGDLDALVGEALEIAAKQEDDELTCLALQQAFSARWRPDTVEWRLDAAARALRLARSVRNLRYEATSGALHAIALVEAGRLDEAHAEMSGTLNLATRHGFATVIVTLELLRAPLSLLAGRDAEAAQSLERVLDLQERVTVSNLPAAVAGLRLLTLMWQSRSAELVAATPVAAPRSEAPLDLVAVLAMLRVGLDGPARELYASMPAVEPDDTYMGMIVAAASAEVAFRLQDCELAKRMYEWLTPYAGGVASAGSTGILGPVDAFLAVAASGSGDSTAASAHADAALDQCARWGMPRASSWLIELRSAAGF